MNWGWEREGRWGLGKGKEWFLLQVQAGLSAVFRAQKEQGGTQMTPSTGFQTRLSVFVTQGVFKKILIPFPALHP